MASQEEIARYQDLRRQGYSGPQAAEMVWGPGGLARMNEEARKRASGNARNNALGQIGGTVAGALGTNYLIANVPAWFASTPATGPVLGEVVAGGTAAGKAAAGSTATTSSGLGGFGSVALPVAAAVAAASTIWEDGLKDIVRGRGKRDDWTNMAVDALTGTSLNMGLRLLGMPSVGRRLGSGKGKAQLERDQVRKALGKIGVLNKQGIGTLADNSVYDFGKDGSTMKWREIDKIADANPNSWGTTVNLTDALVAGYGPKVNSNLSAWYAKAAVSNAADDPEKARANVQHFAQQQGLSLELVKQNLDQGLNDGRMNQQQYDAYINGANRLFAEMPSTASAPGTPGAPAAAPVREVRPDKGTVRRLSPGMYRTDTGGIQTAPTMRQALEKAYRKGDRTKSEGKKG